MENSYMKNAYMKHAYICDGIRSPFGKYGGALALIRPDDLAAQLITYLLEKYPFLIDKVDEVILGCANQAGEDNRNIARMVALLSGLKETVPALTVNRLCASGLDAINFAAHSIKLGEMEMVVAGGVESMSRAPFVFGKNENPFARDVKFFDTTMGWRFVNKKLEKLYGTDSMGETAENVAEQFKISREDQDLFAYRSQQKNAQAQESNFYHQEILPITIPRNKLEDLIIKKDEHPRPQSSLEKLAKLKSAFRKAGSVTAGNSSGINDGACVLLIASEEAVNKYSLTPRAKILFSQAVGVEPRIMGIAPIKACQKVLKHCQLKIEDIGVFELNEAFAAQSLAVIRALNLADDEKIINPHGGAIAIGHPLGASGARLILTAVRQLEESNSKYGLISMCVGVGQGSAMLIEKV